MKMMNGTNDHQILKRLHKDNKKIVKMFLR